MAETGMEKADMKRLLIRSKSEPVNCAIAQGEEPATALLLMHKIKAARAVERMLKDEFPKSKNHRFGTASVDADDNPKLVKFFLNKPISGMARRLVKTLKGTGFTKAIILLEDGTEVEAHEEAEEEAGVAASPGIPAEPQPGVAAGAPPPPSGPDAAKAAADGAALRALLATLAAQIPAVAGEDARRKAELVKLATDANVNLKTNNLIYAATFLAQLKREIEIPVVRAGVTTFAKSRLAWIATRQMVTAEIGKLGAELDATYADSPSKGEISSAFKNKTQALMNLFDDTLVTAIDAVMENAEPARRDALVTTARNAAKDFLGIVDAEELIDALDDNPFMPLNLRATLTTTLGGLSKAMQ